MKYFKTLILLFTISCNQNHNGKLNKGPDSVDNKKDSVSLKLTGADSIAIVEKDDTVLTSAANMVLQSLKAENLQQLTTFINSKWGIRFSPYGYIDTLHNKTFTSTQLLSLSNNKKKISWGKYDGTGSPINLSVHDYFEKFINDVDFLTAKQRSTNKIISGSSSFNNLQLIYPGCNFAEFYFPAVDPKYNGMDWKALILVFKKYNDKDYLVAIIHDQWRI